MKIHHHCHMMNLEDVPVHDRIATLNEAFYAKLVRISDDISNMLIDEIVSAPARLEQGIPDGEFFWDANSAIQQAIDREGSDIITDEADQYAMILIRFESKSHTFISAELMRIDSMDIVTPFGESPYITGIRFSTYN